MRPPARVVAAVALVAALVAVVLFVADLSGPDDDPGAPEAAASSTGPTSPPAAPEDFCAAFEELALEHAARLAGEPGASDDSVAEAARAVRELGAGLVMPPGALDGLDVVLRGFDADADAAAGSADGDATSAAAFGSYLDLTCAPGS